jgi:hypothetical protein
MGIDDAIVDQEGLLNSIEKMIRSLSEPLSRKQKEEGWSEQARNGMLGFWRNLRDHVKHDTITTVDLTTPPSRGLDMWGVQGGELFQVSSQIFMAMLRLADEGKINVDQ